MDTATLISDIGSSAAFGVAAFILLRTQLQEARNERAEREKQTRDERSEWLAFMQNQQTRNLEAIHELKEALHDLRTVIKERK